MHTEIQTATELLAANYEAARKAFKWKTTLLTKLSALIFALEGKPLDTAAVEENVARIKAECGAFSWLRGNSELPVATLMALSGDGETLLRDTLAVFRLLKDEKFGGSDYTVLAACLIARRADWVEYDAIARRARELYRAMREEHRFLTGQDDYIMACLLAADDREPSDAARRMEELYAPLKERFHSGNMVQALAQILTLSRAEDSVLPRLTDLYERFRAQKFDFRSGYTLPSLGMLALQAAPAEQVVADVVSAEQHLKAQKGFGGFSSSKQERLLFSSAIAACVYARDAEQRELAQGQTAAAVTALVIAEQTAVLCAICAAGMVAAASSASS